VDGIFRIVPSDVCVEALEDRELLLGRHPRGFFRHAQLPRDCADVGQQQRSDVVADRERPLWAGVLQQRRGALNGAGILAHPEVHVK